MNYRQIVAEAWQFTQDNRRIALGYGAFPSIFTTIVGIGYLVYQYYSFASSKLFQHWDRSFLQIVFSTALDFLGTHRGFIVPLLVTAVILALAYFFVPVLCEGALIQLIARRRNGQQVEGRKGVTFGLMSFLPLFEYRLFIQTFSVFSIFSIIPSKSLLTALEGLEASDGVEELDSSAFSKTSAASAAGSAATPGAFDCSWC